jgi:putative methyltransferase (TIGR04325 family)
MERPQTIGAGAFLRLRLDLGFVPGQTMAAFISGLNRKEQMSKFQAPHRSLIVDVTPPILLRPMQRLWRAVQGRGFHTFEGCYSNFTDVPGTDSYDDVEFAMASAAFSLEQQKSAATPKSKLDKVGRLFLPLIASQFAGKLLTILDFGGGAASGLFDITDYMVGFELSKLSYVLVETPAMCRAVRDKIAPYVRERFGNLSSMQVVEEIPSSLASPLIVNCGGSIQYVPAYRETLARLASLSPEFFIISGAPMIDKATCVCRHNMYKAVAAWKFNRAEFVDGMQDLGYTCIAMVDHDTAPHTHQNGPVSSNVGMVFCPRSD